MLSLSGKSAFRREYSPVERKGLSGNLTGLEGRSRGQGAGVEPDACHEWTPKTGLRAEGKHGHTRRRSHTQEQKEEFFCELERLGSVTEVAAVLGLAWETCYG